MCKNLCCVFNVVLISKLTLKFATLFVKKKGQELLGRFFGKNSDGGILGFTKLPAHCDVTNTCSSFQVLSFQQCVEGFKQQFKHEFRAKRFRSYQRAKSGFQDVTFRMMNSEIVPLLWGI